MASLKLSRCAHLPAELASIVAQEEISPHGGRRESRDAGKNSDYPPRRQFSVLILQAQKVRDCAELICCVTSPALKPRNWKEVRTAFGETRYIIYTDALASSFSDISLIRELLQVRMYNTCHDAGKLQSGNGIGTAKLRSQHVELVAARIPPRRPRPLPRRCRSTGCCYVKGDSRCLRCASGRCSATPPCS